MLTFATRSHTRRNGFDQLRLVLAVMVAVCHGLVIATGHEPTLPDGVAVSTLGVDGFFVLSGFLVARSYTTLESFPRFAWHRFLRIMPGFWVCLVVIAAVLAPIAAVLRDRSPASVLTGPDPAPLYPLRNAALPMFQTEISGLLDQGQTRSAFDVPLWSLPFEATCYVLVAVLGLSVVLRRRRSWVLVLGVALVGLTFAKQLGLPVSGVAGLFLELVTLFVLGSLAHLYADLVPARGWLAAVGAAVFVGSLLIFTEYRFLGGIGYTYALVWWGLRSPLPMRLRHDLSYGVYIYHWPVLSVLLLTGLVAVGPLPFLAVGLALTGILATCSWFAVERPALRLKNLQPPGRRRETVSEPAPVLAAVGEHSRTP